MRSAAAVVRACSGCGTPGRRRDTCPVCRANGRGPSSHGVPAPPPDRSDPPEDPRGAPTIAARQPCPYCGEFAVFGPTDRRCPKCERPVEVILLVVVRAPR